MVTKTTVKKTAKKAAPKRPTTKKTSVKHVPMKSFRAYKDPKPFMRLSITRQTVYWGLLVVIIFVTQLWLLKIQLDISNLTDLLRAE